MSFSDKHKTLWNRLYGAAVRFWKRTEKEGLKANNLLWIDNAHDKMMIVMVCFDERRKMAQVIRQGLVERRMPVDPTLNEIAEGER